MSRLRASLSFAGVPVILLFTYENPGAKDVGLFRTPEQ